jgi:hypothetical protein
VREDRSRACSREQSFATHSNASIGLRPNRAGSETVESTLILRKPSPFAGRRRKRIFGRFTRDREGLQPHGSMESVTRVLEGHSRRGAHRFR